MSAASANLVISSNSEQPFTVRSSLIPIKRVPPAVLANAEIVRAILKGLSILLLNSTEKTLFELNIWLRFLTFYQIKQAIFCCLQS
jgi:hypothetical protein